MTISIKIDPTFEDSPEKIRSFVEGYKSMAERIVTSSKCELVIENRASPKNVVHVSFDTYNSDGFGVEISYEELTLIPNPVSLDLQYRCIVSVLPDLHALMLTKDEKVLLESMLVKRLQVTHDSKHIVVPILSKIQDLPENKF